MEDVEFLPLNKVALDYLLKERKLSPDAIEVFDLSLSQYGEILIPFRDHNGDVRLIKRRSADGSFLKRRRRKEDGSYEDYECKSDCVKGGKPTLLGSNLITDFNKPLVICFGDYDTLTLYDVVPSISPVSPPFGDKSLTWIDHHYDWLDNFSKIIIFPDFDNDKKIRKHLFDKIEELAQRLGKHKCHVVEEKYLLGCKDPNDLYVKCGAEAVTTAIANASFIPEVGLERLVDYKGQEFVDGVPTGYADYDAATGGLVHGGLTIESGDNNAGKTTKMLNIMARVVAQRVPVFYWSGEQRPDRYRWWFEQILAGPNFVDSRFSDKTGRTYYFLKNDLISRVREWYGDYFYHYDRRGIDSPEFFRVLEIAVRRHGTFLACIDNLMAFTGADIDYYAAQGAFVESVKNFATDWNIHIMLATHNKKNDPNAPGTKDDVEGSKKITNWADVVVQNYRVPEMLKKTKYPGLDSIWSITKNRESEDLSDIGILYEPTSRRLIQSAHPEDVNRLFGWENEEDIGRFVPKEDNNFSLNY